MRTIKGLNNDWYYNSNFNEKIISQNYIDDKCFKKVRIPHANIELPYNYFDDNDFRFVSCYKRIINVSKEYENNYIFIDFEGVMAYSKVFLNGKFSFENKGVYSSFRVNITETLVFDEDNILTVMVDSTERPDIPPFGGVIDYLTYGGIYREVQLRIVEKTYIQNVFITAENVLEDNKKLMANVKLVNNSNADLSLIIKLVDKDKVIKETQVIVNSNETKISLENLKTIKLWDLENPYLYTVDVSIFKDGVEIDKVHTTFGFREAKFCANGFTLNGDKIKLIGLNRHQSYPYVGYAMPKRAQQKDADILKDLGLNIVRTSHYPQSRHFLDRCDEIGLLVFEEIPGWQHIGDEVWKQQVIQDVRDMIIRDRNHPSIVIWGVRINESQDNHDLYLKTNALARELDQTRQTGGVRYITGSELLEDVYTMNDFIHDGGYKKILKKQIKNFSTYDNTEYIDGEVVGLRNQKDVTCLDECVPYLVTEYNGHMYPTKSFDQEERVVEHALRHAKIQNDSFLDDSITGAIGWCAFDYNTHADFGSGDKICYHGIMDMFRIPKFAAYLYKSQKDPKEEYVLQPLTYWSRGERSIGGIIPLVIFTNCDYVEFYYGNDLIGKYTPNMEKFKGLPHAPIIID